MSLPTHYDAADTIWQRTEGMTHQELSDLVAARDEQVRADERARVSVVHSTLTDEQLVDELVRRGVLEDEREHREVRMCGGCWTHGFEYHTCDASCTYRSDEVRHERRVVGPWRPDTRTAEQRTDDAIATLRRRLTGEGGTS